MLLLINNKVAKGILKITIKPINTVPSYKLSWGQVSIYHGNLLGRIW
jgi:hypothetical protein